MFYSDITRSHRVFIKVCSASEVLFISLTNILWELKDRKIIFNSNNDGNNHNVNNDINNNNDNNPTNNNNYNFHTWEL